MTLARVAQQVLVGSDLPVLFDAYDGSTVGPEDAPSDRRRSTVTWPAR